MRKKYIVSVFFIHMSLFCTQWMGESYHLHSTIQDRAARKLLKNCCMKPHYHVLDAGCGSGRNTSLLAKKVPKGFVYGIDLSPSMIEFAKKKYLSNNIEFLVASIEDYEGNHLCDVAGCFYVLHWIQDQEKALQALSNNLKPGGMLVLCMVHKQEDSIQKATFNVIKSKKWHDTLDEKDFVFYPQTIDSLQAMLNKAGFEINKIEVVDDRMRFSKKNFARWIDAWGIGFSKVAHMNEDKRKNFIDDIVAAYTKTNPIRRGKVVYTAHQLMVVAQKKH